MDLSRALASVARFVRWHRRLVAAVCTGLAVLTTLSVLSPAPQPTVAVVVAARSVGAGARLVDADLRLASFPASLVPDGSVQQLDQAVGHTVSAGISAGTPITASTFTSASTLTKSGEQLVPFRVPDATVLSFVHVGDLVSVVALASGATTGAVADGTSGTGTGTGDSTGSSDSGVLVLARRVRVAALPQSSDGGGLVGSSSSGALVVVSCDASTAATLAAWAASGSLGITVG